MLVSGDTPAATSRFPHVERCPQARLLAKPSAMAASATVTVTLRRGGHGPFRADWMRPFALVPTVTLPNSEFNRAETR